MRFSLTCVAWPSEHRFRRRKHNRSLTAWTFLYKSTHTGRSLFRKISYSGIQERTESLVRNEILVAFAISIAHPRGFKSWGVDRSLLHASIQGDSPPPLPTVHSLSLPHVSSSRGNRHCPSGAFQSYQRLLRY